MEADDVPCGQELSLAGLPEAGGLQQPQDRTDGDSRTAANAKLLQVMLECPHRRLRQALLLQ
eukprot:2516393-Alexandrium_andersonii.AAC.1